MPCDWIDTFCSCEFYVFFRNTRCPNLHRGIQFPLSGRHTSPRIVKNYEQPSWGVGFWGVIAYSVVIMTPVIIGLFLLRAQRAITYGLRSKTGHFGSRTDLP
ncbi:hypothetical protein PENSPDRAFT_61922 [Peniophora sp. CONT]|nr:hypothetical protein PENSPDRAFT_61922 [Peniophora sp. CONT]